MNTNDHHIQATVGSDSQNRALGASKLIDPCWTSLEERNTGTLWLASMSMKSNSRGIMLQDVEATMGLYL